MGTNKRNQTGWRRLTGWLAAYLLVLHVGFAGAATGHFFAQSNDAVHDTALCLKGWRRLMGWLAAYLVVLNVSFAGASTGHYFAQANDAAAAFCLNGTDGRSTPDGAPVHSSHGKVHCVLCSGGGSPALSSAEVFAAPQLTRVSALTPASERVPGQSRRHLPNQSRAPPIEV